MAHIKDLEARFKSTLDEMQSLLGFSDYGWLDGGCYVLARGIELWSKGEALRRCLIRSNAYTQICDHWFAVFEKEGMQWALDGEGIHARSHFKERFYRQMGTSVSMGYALKEGDETTLPHPETPVDEALSLFVAARLEAWMPFDRFMEALPEPELITPDDFLCGADGPDPWCNQSFGDYIKDIDTEADPQTLVAINDEYMTGLSSDAVLLIHRPSDRVVGYYCAGAVCIDDEHQGQGLSAPLILAAYDFFGGPPTSMLDEQMFSEAGYAAHCAAWRHGVEKGYFVEQQTPEPAFQFARP